MMFQHSAIGLLPVWLLTISATGLAGCDRQAASQTHSPGKVEIAQAASDDETAAASARSSIAETVKPAEADASQTTFHDTGAREQPGQGTAATAPPPSNDPPPRPAGLRPKADRSAAADGVEKITFDDLILGMQADMVYRPWMLESETNGGRAKELDGKRVRLAGVMHGGVQSTKKNKEFVLLRNKECKFGPGGQADHLAKIFMKEGKTVAFTDETVKVEGTLRIKPEMGEDGNTWSIYEIDGAELK